MESAQHVATEASKLDLVPGRSPVSVAAAAIYMVSQVCVGGWLCTCVYVVCIALALSRPY